MARFSTLWTEVRRAVGQRADIDTEIKAAMNDAVVDLILMFKIRQAIDSVTFLPDATEGAHTLDPTVLDVISVRDDTNNVLLTPGDYMDYAQFDPTDTDEFGTPTMWFVDKDKLYLYNAIPDGTDTITYRYLRRFAVMTGATDTFPLPREWERPAKLLAKSYVLELLGQSEKALAAHQQAMAISNMRVQQGGWGEKLKGDNRIDIGQYNDEGF